MNDDIQLDFLRLLIELVREHYELTGSFPSPAQLQAKIDHPGQ